MAVSSAPVAVSKLLNMRRLAVSSILRHQVLNTSAAAKRALLEPQSPNLIRMENRPAADFLNRYLFEGEDLNLHASDLPISLQWPFGLSGIEIEAARTYVPRDDEFQDLDDDDDDDDDDNEDDDLDDLDIQDYSGSDFDDEGDTDDDNCPRGRIH